MLFEGKKENNCRNIILPWLLTPRPKFSLAASQIWRSPSRFECEVAKSDHNYEITWSEVYEYLNINPRQGPS